MTVGIWFWVSQKPPQGRIKKNDSTLISTLHENKIDFLTWIWEYKQLKRKKCL